MLKLKAIPVIEGNNNIDGFHLMWTPFLKGQLPLSGYTIWRRKSAGNSKKPVCRVIDGTSIEVLHNSYFLVFNEPDIIFDKIFFHPVTGDMDSWKQSIRNFVPIAGSASTADFPVFAYDCHFTIPVSNTHVNVEIKPALNFILAIGFRDGRVVDSKIEKTSLNVGFKDPVNRIRFYILAKAERITVCYRPHDHGKPEEWELLQKNLSLPFTGFSDAVNNTDQEFHLFKNRIKDGDVPDVNEFEKISSLVKESYQFADPLLLPCTSVLEYMKPEGSTGEGSASLSTAPFSMLQTFCIYNNWRMGLGFGYLDQKNLEKDAVYDYKIRAEFHKNILEKIYDFHTVPLNTRIDASFSLAGIFFFLDSATTVNGYPGQSVSSDTNPFVKGIRINSWVRINFPQATKQFVLYCFGSTGASVRVGTSLTTISMHNRTEIILPSVTDTIILYGRFILTGIAYPSLTPGENPLEKTEITDYSFGNVYANTERLQAPSFLEAVNNQKPWVPMEKKAPEGLGFMLKWQQPATAGAVDPGMWPPDSPAPPLPELGYYKLEYRAAGSSSPLVWHYYDEKAVDFPNGMIVHSDGYTSTPLPVTYGCDLLNVFYEGPPPGGTYSLTQRFKHILGDLKGNLKAIPGSNYQYRIWSVDLLGRTSEVPRESLLVRLEKRQPPPTPVGLAQRYLEPVADNGYKLRDERTDLRPKHVYARVLLSSSRLTDQERTLLGDRDHITVLTWTYGDEEINMDSLAKEFRIYIRKNEHGIIKGSFAADAIADGSNWRMDVVLSNGVTANEFTGQLINLNRVPFRIVSHNGGTTVGLVVSAPLTAPGKIPQAGNFELYRKPSGEESRPASWDNRIAVVPRTSNFVYQYILETGELISDPVIVTGLPGIHYNITPEGKDTRCWLGVSAADSEAYVNDQVLTAGVYSPRPGNESGIVTANVSAKYIGRPIFTPPPPLDDVPVAILDEVGSDELLLNVIPFESLPFLEMDNNLRIERISGTDILSVLRVEESAIQLVDVENPIIVTDWMLNPADDAALRAAFSNGTNPIPAKFIWSISKRDDLHLDLLWKQVNPQPILCTEPFKDRLPNTGERYIYRARLVNSIGMPSENAAFFPNVWRSPDKRIPAPVTISAIEIITEDADTLVVSPEIKMNGSTASIVKGILLFAGSFPVADNVTDDELKNAALLKIPNRPDFLSEQLYRVRAGSLLIQPVFIPVTEVEKETKNEIVTLTWKNIRQNFSYNNNLVFWAAAVSNDNILSALSGFKKKFSGLTPPIIPSLMMSTGAGELEISFTTASPEGFLFRIERSVEEEDKGFTAVSGWFKVVADELIIKQFAMPGKPTWFRLKIKNNNNREYTGTSILFNT